MLCSELLLSILSVNFWFSSVIECFCKQMHIIISLTSPSGHNVGFCCSQYVLRLSHPLSLLILKVALMLLGFYQHQSCWFTYHSTSSANCPSSQLANCIKVVCACVWICLFACLREELRDVVLSLVALSS